MSFKDNKKNDSFKSIKVQVHTTSKGVRVEDELLDKLEKKGLKFSATVNAALRAYLK